MRSQVVKRCSEQDTRVVAPLCKLLGYSPQAYYKQRPTAETEAKEREKEVLYTSIVFYCQRIRRDDALPKAGLRELYTLCQEYFGDRFTIGRDRFYNLLRANNLVLRHRKRRPRTTNSNHNYHIYEDLLNTDPKLVAQRPGQPAVADITYIACKDNFAYLSLITDAYSRCIVGYCLHKDLSTVGPLRALDQAFKFYEEHNIKIDRMIHHSDRGVQYASKAYVQKLHAQGCRISMTQTGDPLHNAMAERINNTIKNSWFVSCENQTFQEAQEAVDRAIVMYNEARPHQAIGNLTPMQMIMSEATNPLVTDELTHIKPSPKLLKIARQRAKKEPRK